MTDSRQRRIPRLLEGARAAAALGVFALLLALSAGCSSGGTPSSDSAAARADEHADDEHGDGGDEEGANRVTLTEVGAQTAQIRVEPVAAGGGSEALGEALAVPGQIAFDPRRVAIISPRTGGRVERVEVIEGDYVGRGATVARLTSTAFVTAQSDYVQAARRAALLEGTADAEGARALAAAARRRLRLIGASERSIGRLAAGGEPADFLDVTAPFAGTIVETKAVPGMAVEAGTPLFTLADLSVMDVVADVPERALPLVSVGQRATISVAAYAGLAFEGRVERVHPELNPETRTVQAVIHAPNPTRALRSGMFATVHLEVGTRATPTTPAGDNVIVGGTATGATPAGGGPAGTPAAQPALTIPETAVVTDGEQRFVFVEVGQRAYERREVRVASLAPPGSAVATTGRVAVLDGLRAGERVVVSGAFTLKSELAKAALGEHGH